MPWGPLPYSSPRLFAVSRVQMKVLPGNTRSGTRTTTFTEVSAARRRAGAVRHILGPPARVEIGLVKRCMGKAAAGGQEDLYFHVVKLKMMPSPQENKK